MENTRTFIAVNLPEKVKEEIFERLSRKIDRKKCKVVGKENLHVTMKFLGYLNKENLKRVKCRIKKLEMKKFEIEINEIGDFNGRVIWLGVNKGKNELVEISEKLNDLLEIKDERFHPHITLARNKEFRRKEVDNLITKLKKENYSATVTVESVDLMESKLLREGPKYSVIEKVLLI